MRMELETDHRRLLREYLLGQSNEARREQAEGYFEDVEMFDELIEVENDLLDQYVRGELSPDEHAAFARYLVCMPDGREQVAFAKALTEVVAEGRQSAEAILPSETDSASAVRASEPVSWRQNWLALFRLPAIRLPLAVAAALIVLLAAGLSLLLVERQLLRRDIQTHLAQRETEQEASRQKAQALEQQLTAQRAHTEQLQTALEQAEQRTESQAREIARLQNLPSPIATLIFPALSLLKGDAPQTTLTLILEPHTQWVSLAVPIGGKEEYSRYSALLQTRDGQRVWEQAPRPLRASSRTLVFRLPADKLPPDDYTLTVTLTAKKDDLPLPRDYHFTVVKRTEPLRER